MTFYVDCIVILISLSMVILVSWQKTKGGINPETAWVYFMLVFIFGTGIGMLCVWLISVPTITYLAEKAGTGTETPTVTLLYDPKAIAGLNSSGEPLPLLYPGQRAVPYNGLPRWVIPGKIKPLINGSSSFASYTYYDPKTNTYDGPYLPETPTVRP